MRGRRGRKREIEAEEAGWATGTLDRAAILGPEVVDDTTVHLVVDLALRIGELQLAGGAGAADVTATMLGVVNAYGLPQCEVDVIFTSITVCCHRGVEVSPITTTRVVRFRTLDYTRLAALDRLVVRIVRGRLTPAEAYRQLDALLSGDRTYPRWVATAAWAGMAASLAVLFGADIRLIAVAAAVTALVDRIGRMLNRRALPFFFQQVVGGAIVTVVAVTLSDLLLPQAQPSMVLAASLIVLLSGLSLVGTVQDAITGFYVTAAGRAFEVAIMSAGLIAGIVLGLQATNPFVNLAPPGFPAPGLADLPVQVLTAALASAFFALASYGPPRALVAAGIGGALSFTTYAVASMAEASPAVASGLGAILIGFVGRVVSRRLRLPPLVMAVAGITPLLPGLTLYRGVLELTVHNDPTGLITLLFAGSIGVALAAGVVLGEFLARPVRTGLGRLERRLAGARLLGPPEDPDHGDGSVPSPRPPVRPTAQKTRFLRRIRPLTGNKRRSSPS